MASLSSKLKITFTLLSDVGNTFSANQTQLGCMMQQELSSVNVITDSGVHAILTCMTSLHAIFLHAGTTSLFEYINCNIMGLVKGYCGITAFKFFTAIQNKELFKILTHYREQVWALAYFLVFFKASWVFKKL